MNDFFSLGPNGGFFWEQLRPWIKAGDKVLDLECGAGSLLDVLVDQDIHYVGLDNSPRLVRTARKKYPNQQFLVGDLLKVTFPSDTFDKALTLFDKAPTLTFIQRLPSEEKQLDVLSEARRILKPFGLLFFEVWFPPSDWSLLHLQAGRESFPRSGLKDLRRLTQKVGLEVVQQGERKLAKKEKLFYLIAKKV